MIFSYWSFLNFQTGPLYNIWENGFLIHSRLSIIILANLIKKLRNETFSKLRQIQIQKNNIETSLV